MDALAFSLKTMCQHNADGSRMTQAQRARGLSFLADELRKYGYRLPDAQSLKPKHVNRLMAEWQAEGIDAGTLKNRAAWLRWWAMKAAKPGLLPRRNARLNIANKVTFKGKRAAITDTSALENLTDERHRLAIRLQMAFGLRAEESCKFNVSEAFKGDHLAMRPGWTKGGRFRTIPIVHERQRALLDEVREVCGRGAIVPDSMSYIRFRRQLENATLKAGITNMHKHRHWYACWRYKTLSGGIEPPSNGGPLHDSLTPEQRERLDAVRLEVSAELGHGRKDVTNAYLGNRWAGKATG